MTIPVRDQSAARALRSCCEINFVLHVAIGNRESTAVATGAFADAGKCFRGMFARQKTGANPRGNSRRELLFVHPCQPPSCKQTPEGMAASKSSCPFRKGNTTEAHPHLASPGVRVQCSATIGDPRVAAGICERSFSCSLTLRGAAASRSQRAGDARCHHGR